jgi:hypothetical protein
MQHDDNKALPSLSDAKAWCTCSDQADLILMVLALNMLTWCTADQPPHLLAQCWSQPCHCTWAAGLPGGGNDAAPSCAGPLPWLAVPY